MEDTSKVLVIRKNKGPEESDNKSKAEVIELGRRQLEDFLYLIVDHPTEVSVSVTQGERTTVYKIECTQRNLGKILGCKGRMITSLRNMILAVTARHGFRSIIEVPYYANVEDPCHRPRVANDF